MINIYNLPYLHTVMLLTLKVSVPFLLANRVRRNNSNSLFVRIGPIGNRCTICRKESTVSPPNFVLHCLGQPQASVRSAAILSTSSAFSLLERLPSTIDPQYIVLNSCGPRGRVVTRIISPLCLVTVRA